MGLARNKYLGDAYAAQVCQMCQLRYIGNLYEMCAVVAPGVIDIKRRARDHGQLL